MRIFVDLSEFLSNPHRSGIQRVCGELCRYWPSDLQLRPVKVDPQGRLIELPTEALSVIKRYFEAPNFEALECRERIVRLAAHADSTAQPVALNGGDRVLVPEVFYDTVRLDFFELLSPSVLSSFHFIVFDLLPLTHPQYFPAHVPHECISRYFRVIRRAVHLGFISRATQMSYLGRLCRNSKHHPGVVFKLGSDGLGPRCTGQVRQSNVPTFVVVGTIEPRKNHGMILEALADMLEAKPAMLRLIFAGRMGWVNEDLFTRIRSLSHENEAFCFVEDPSDHVLRELIQSAQASIFLSSAEGFGLPPCESLWLGVPVIASTGIPSLQDIGDAGIHLVEPLSAENIRTAVVAFLDNAYRQKKAREASRLTLPTWRSFAHEVAAWIAHGRDHEGVLGKSLVDQRIPYS